MSKEDTDDSQPDEAVTMSTPRWNIGDKRNVSKIQCVLLMME